MAISLFYYLSKRIQPVTTILDYQADNPIAVK